MSRIIFNTPAPYDKKIFDFYWPCNVTFDSTFFSIYKVLEISQPSIVI